MGCFFTKSDEGKFGIAFAPVSSIAKEPLSLVLDRKKPSYTPDFGGQR
jgi:hypothetical protein